MPTNPILFHALDRLVGQHLQRLVRVSEESPETIAEWYGLVAEECFSFAPGVVYLTTQEGDCLGINSDPSQCSLVMWSGLQEETSGHKTFQFEPKEGFPARGRIHSVRLYREAPRNPSFIALARYSALVLTLEDRREIAFVHGLHDDSDDFAVILREEILPRFRATLEVVYERTFIHN